MNVTLTGNLLVARALSGIQHVAVSMAFLASIRFTAKKEADPLWWVIGSNTYNFFDQVRVGRLVKLEDGSVWELSEFDLGSCVDLFTDLE